MADIDVKRAHELGLEGARALAERMAEQLGRRFDLKGRWEGDTLRFERPGVSGSLAVTGTELRLRVTLGFLFKAMKGSIESAVVRELDTLVAQGASAPVRTAAATPKKAPPPPKKDG
jgi:putative polyhydroxyalkanoate system protein